MSLRANADANKPKVNAVSESFFQLLKRERIKGKNIRPLQHLI
jgi:hypothetical protein